MVPDFLVGLWGTDAGGGIRVSQLCIKQEADKLGVFYGWFRDYYDGVKTDQYDVLGKYDAGASEEELTMGW